MKISIQFALIFLFLSLIFNCQVEPTATTTTTCKTDWTVMIYQGADCNLLVEILNDLKEIKNGTNNKMRIISLIDVGQSSFYTKKIGVEFAGVKMFLVTNNNLQMLDGGDILPEITTTNEYYYGNTGSAQLLNKFIAYCKTYFPADKYALFMEGHGSGVDESFNNNNGRNLVDLTKAMIKDDSNNDWIYTAELTDAFTQNENVDLMVLDCCNMAYAEIAYQYRPGNNSFNADYMIASSPIQINEGLPYDKIFSKVTPTMSVIDFGKLILEEQQKYIQKNCKSQWNFGYTDHCVLGLYDLSKVESLKNCIDQLVPSLFSKEYIEIYQTYLSEAIKYDTVMYDGYDFFTRLSECSQLSSEIQNKCKLVADKFDEMTIASFIEKNPEATEIFTPNKNGLSIFAPLNSEKWNNYKYYNSIDTASVFGYGYGYMSWCIDGCDVGNDTPENWFELLDYWFDSTNDITGGNNGYRY